MQRRVVIVGGGLAGLVAADRVLRADPSVAVTVLEGAEAAGGKVRMAEVGGVPIDVGAESILASSAAARALLDDLGLSDRIVHPEPVAATIWIGDRRRAIPAGTFMGVPGSRADLADLLGGADPEDLPGTESRPRSAIPEDLSVAEAVTGRFGPAVLDRLVEPLLGGVHAGRADRLSLRSTMPRLWEEFRRDGDLEAAVDRVLPAPASPAGRPSPRLMGLDGGIGRLVGSLVGAIEARGGHVETGRLVRRVESAGIRWQVIHGPNTAERTVEADAVVLATPAAPTARLLGTLAPAAALAAAQIDYASMAVIAMALPRDPGLRLPGSGFLVPASQGRLIKAATFSGSKWAWVDRAAAAEGLVLARASVGRAGDVAPLQRDDHDLMREALGEIAVAVGQQLPDPVDWRVQRWGGGLPQYEVGHHAWVSTIRDAAADLPGLALAGAAYDGLGTAAVIESGDRAARVVLAHLDSVGPRSVTG